MRLNWGHGITAVYAIFALATIWFVVFAVGHPVDLVSPDYYTQALGHDARQAASGRAAAVADEISARLREDGRALVIALPASRGSDRPSGQARLYRPANARDDHAWPLALDGQGRQTIPTAGFPSGRWILQLDWRLHGVAFYTEIPVVLP